MFCNGQWQAILNPRSDQPLISPYNNIAKSFIKTKRIKKMTTDLRSFDC